MRNTSLIHIYISRMQSSVQAQWVELGKEVPMQESKGTQLWLREGPRRVLVFRPLQTIGNIIDGGHIKETRESFYQPLSPHSDQSLTCSEGSLLFKLRGFSLVLDKETGQAQGGEGLLLPRHLHLIVGRYERVVDTISSCSATLIVQQHHRHSP